jgi:hypothetical protein
MVILLETCDLENIFLFFGGHAGLKVVEVIVLCPFIMLHWGASW